MFDFSDMLRNYETEIYKIDKSEGYYDYNNGGKWVEGSEAKTSLKVIVMPLNADDLKFDEGGTYTTNDRKIYVHESLNIGQEIEIKGSRYTVHSQKDYSDYANGLRIYYVKRVGESSD